MIKKGFRQHVELVILVVLEVGSMPLDSLELELIWKVLVVYHQAL